MIDSLQSLRGLFAVCIFLHHYNLRPGAWEAVFPAGGSMGVAFFLVLSGFVMSLGHSRKVLEPEFRLGPFMERRFVRTWPLHIIATLLFIALNFHSFTTESILPLLTNVSLLQSWGVSVKYFFSGNSVSWCLSDMMFFYLMFPFLVRMFRRRPVGASIAAACYTAAYFTVCRIIPSRLMEGIIYIFPLMRLADFMVGMALYLLWEQLINTKRSLCRAQCTLIEAFSVLLCVGAVLLWPFVSLRTGLASWWWMPIAAIITAFSLSARLSADKHGGLISRLLQWKPLVIFGNASFSFYVFHVLGIRICKILADKVGLSPSPEAALLPVFIIVTAASLAIWKFIEMPLVRRFADLRIFR
ncbi:MAG: acyltransferase [Muribaculaceae bacterium]|nr:acyltransferase [Muribaculaceae bacterium]